MANFNAVDRVLERKIFNELRNSGPLCPGQLSVTLHTGGTKILETLQRMKQESLVSAVDEGLEKSTSLNEEELKFRRAWSL
jgi:hypothetical protein